MKKTGVYTIVHKQSGLTYVGQSNGINYRWSMHIEGLKENTHHNCKLQELWNKEGASAFEFKIVALAPEGLSPLQIQRWLVGKEQEIYRELVANNIALNIVIPEIFTTAEALAEYKQEKHKSVKIRNKIITDRIKEIKSIVNTNNTKIKILLTVIRQHETIINSVASLIKSNTGLRKFLFGKTSQQPLDEFKTQLEHEKNKLNTILPTYNKLVEETLQLKLERYKLQSSYPKILENKIKRTLARHGVSLDDDKIH